MKTKQRLIGSFTLEYHPLVTSLLCAKIFAPFSPGVIEHLNEREIQLLLQTITLHVIPTTSDQYQLLTHDPLFALVRQHPCVQSKKVSLCEYQHSTDNIEQIITTLMLTLPALQYNYQSSTLKMLASRLNTAKSNLLLPTKSLLKKNQLALFAGVSPSAIRLGTNKQASNDDKGNA